MFRAVHPSAKDFKRIMDAAYSLLDEVTFVVSPEGMQLIDMDIHSL